MLLHIIKHPLLSKDIVTCNKILILKNRPFCICSPSFRTKSVVLFEVDHMLGNECFAKIKLLHIIGHHLLIIYNKI